MKKRPTQADVARLAGVSRATVSYIVNDVSDDRVSITEETRQRVLLAVEKLDYQPDATARSLRLGRTQTIGLLLPDMRNPHLWQIARGAEEATQAAGYDLLLTSTSLDANREIGMVNALSRRRVDGLILMLTYSDRLTKEFRRLVKKRMPMVALGEQIPELDVVLHNHGDTSLKIMQYLFALGHRRIGIIYGVDSRHHGNERLEAYQVALRKQGLPVDNTLIARCGGNLEEGYRAARELLNCQPRPTALLAINDLLAISALRAAADRGLSIPNDLSLVGFDDIDVASYITPALTTVRGNAEDMGRAAVRLILDRLQDPSRLPQQVTIPGQLIIRESTGPTPNI